LKLETCTPIRTFKIRGALVKLRSLLDRGELQAGGAGVVTASAGNHGLAVAHAARLLSIRAVVCVPSGANPQKAALIRAEGATILEGGVDYQAAFDRSVTIGQQQGLTLVHAYDDLNVILGQATIGVELVDSKVDFDCVLTGIGGGGLVTGVGVALKQLRTQTTGPVRVVGVAPEGADSMIQSVQQGRIVQIDRVNTIADGLSARKPGHHTLLGAQHYVDLLHSVSDDDLRHAMTVLLNDERIIAEPAGIAGLALLLQRLRLKDNLRQTFGQSIVVVISGSNISDSIFSQLLARANSRE